MQKDNELDAKHNIGYNSMVPSDIFDVEDSDEIAEAYLDMFGYTY